MKTITILILINLIINQAQAQQNCWEQEIDTTTKKMFSEENWSSTLEVWRRQEPVLVSYFELFRAWKVYKSESKNLKKIKKDKQKHCYLGCRITQDVSYKTSVYLAWYKELKDLSDCDKKTFFETLDAEATITGADIGMQTNVPAECQTACL